MELSNDRISVCMQIYFKPFLVRKFTKQVSASISVSQSLSLSLSLSLSHPINLKFGPFLLPLQEVHEARIEMRHCTNEWYQGVHAVSSEEEMEEETSHTMLKMDDNLI